MVHRTDDVTKAARRTVSQRDSFAPPERAQPFPLAICRAGSDSGELPIAFANAAFVRLVGAVVANGPAHVRVTCADGTTIAGRRVVTERFSVDGSQLRLVAVLDVPEPPTGDRRPAKRNARRSGDSVTALRRELREHKRVERMLLEAASRDGLTGLPNRSLFLEHVKEALERRRRDGVVAVLFIDCDRFKIVNDTFGHLVGDLLLVEVSRRLEECLRPTDVLARVGGDEFVVLLESGGRRSTAAAVATRIAKQLTTPFRCAGEEFYLTASVGVAEASTGQETADELVRNADIAMYKAKQRGGAASEIFTTELHDRVRRRRLLETDLRHAVESGELGIAFQPIVRLADGVPVALEALARWRHPELGEISPSEFVPIAEESQLVVALGDLMLQQACEALATVQARYGVAREIAMSVNVSVKQLLDDGFSRRVAGALMSSGIRAEHLRLEVTETALMSDAATVAQLLTRLRGIGVHSCVDDFGTGFASLTYLRRLPVSALKIDRSFVSAAGVELADPSIVEMIVALCRHIGLGVVAEGVETPDQAAALTALGCEHGQGFFYSRALDRDALGAYLATFERSTEAAPTSTNGR